MEPSMAGPLADAYARTTHPRLDFRTEEGRRYAMRLAPYLAPIIRPNMHALDLGCSTGKSTFMLCELGAKVTAIDVSFSILRRASQIGRSINATASFVSADYAQLPFRSESFELILFPHNVVECSPEEFERVVTESARVLAHHGCFVITVSQKWCDGNPQCRPQRKDGTITIPDQRTYPCSTYTWSVDEVRRVAESRFTLHQSQPISDNSEFLVFTKP